MFALRKNSLIIKSLIRHQHIYIDRYDISSTGVPLEEFHQRRCSLVNLIRQSQTLSSKNFSICLPASTRLFMGPDVAYFPFKQQADFYYLTGCMQADAVLLLNGDDRTFSTNLFLSRCPMKSIDEYERWFGATITDKDQICQLFGVDQVRSIEDLSSFKIPSSSVLFCHPQAIDSTSVNSKNLIPFLKRFSSSMVCKQLNSFLHSLRSIKSLTEQNLIRQACELAAQAFTQTMRHCPKTVSNERFIQARFQYECQSLENTSMAFYPVVAANGRSNVLHYQQNSQPIDRDDLVMLDGGCLFKQYCSDITRLWPINGRFSSEQRQLYEILLTVQKDLIGFLNSGVRFVSRAILNALTDQYLIKYLREELILSRTIDDDHAKRIINYLSPTSVSHHLGLDVHDCESVSFAEQLRAGNVITIEPGLYIPFDCSDVPPVYRGFATRLEDDVLLTEQGCEVLSKACPKEIDHLYQILDQRDN